MHDPMIALAILGVLNAAVGAAYYLRIVATVYMDDELEPSRSYGGGAVRLAVGLCALPLLLIFAWPGYLRARLAPGDDGVAQGCRRPLARRSVGPTPDGAGGP